MSTLTDYGWNDDRQSEYLLHIPHQYIPARVIADYGRRYKIALPEPTHAQLAGSLTHKLASNDMPKVGDWVAVERIGDEMIIHNVLPRSTEIARGNASKQLEKQIVAANVDIAFVVQALDQDFSLERLERYVFQLNSQNISPIVLLNKSDTCTDAEDKRQRVVKLGVDVYVLSALYDEDLAAIRHMVPTGKTAVIMGSSGAGKSTLTNRLLNDTVQETGAIRERDGKGRHTTVHRELFILPDAGMIIDTPGIRELQLWGTEQDLKETFSDVAQLAHGCRYKNCSHTTEDDCAIQRALQTGSLDTRRYAAYVNFKQELQKLEVKRVLIDERRTAYSKATAKRRRARTLRSERDKDLY